MNDKLKGLLLGIAIGMMLTGATVFAANGITIKVSMQNLGIYLDGLKKTSADSIVYNGRTYVPIRSISDALGKQVRLMNHNLYIGKQSNMTITETQAIQLVRQQYGIEPSSNLTVQVDHTEGNSYLIHVYEFVIDDSKTGEGHTATYGWYYVDKSTGNITSMFE